MTSIERRKTGIIVYGHTRPSSLKLVLESLSRQKSLSNTVVWLDGHRGRNDLIGKVQACQRLSSEFAEATWITNTNLLTQDRNIIYGLSEMTRRFERVIVLEDDCFPTSRGIELFERELDNIEHEPGIFSVYGHHFLVPFETDTITRFQGWGFATTSVKLVPILAKLKILYMLPEPEFTAWVDNELTPEIEELLSVTPPRDPRAVLRRYFAWDECIALLTCLAGLRHKKTKERAVYNFGLGEGQHFYESEEAIFRAPPFNMIAPGEVWNYF